MHARKPLVWLTLSSSLGAAAIAACSSQSTPATDGGADAAIEATTPQTGSEAGPDSGVDAALDAPACFVADASAADVAAGPSWACYEGVCASELTACAADCVCNDAILGALLCAADGGGATACFNAAFTGAVLLHTASTQVVGCLLATNMDGGCTFRGGAPPEAGSDGAADAGDAGPEDAADAGESDSPAAG